MAQVLQDYFLNWASQLKPAIHVAPYSTDSNSCSLKLFGHGTEGYGDGLQENLLKMLENFASSTPPLGSTEGQLWYDVLNKCLKIHNGTSYVDLAQIVIPRWVIITNNPSPAVTGGSYMCNTANAAFGFTLPPNPAANDLVRIADYAGTFATHNLTVLRNGSKIMGLDVDMVINTDNVSITLQYIDAIQGWKRV